MSLPLLPDELARFTPTEGEHRALKMFVREYGQACREAALKEANKREPLSEVQLFVLWHSLPDDDGAFPDFVDAARAIEQAHHITVKVVKP